MSIPLDPLLVKYSKHRAGDLISDDDDGGDAVELVGSGANCLVMPATKKKAAKRKAVPIPELPSRQERRLSKSKARKIANLEVGCSSWPRNRVNGGF